MRFYFLGLLLLFFFIIALKRVKSQSFYGIYKGCFDVYSSGATQLSATDQYGCLKACYENNPSFAYSAQKNGTNECYCAYAMPPTPAYNDTMCNCPGYTCAISSSYLRVSQIFDGSISCPKRLSVNQPFDCQLSYVQKNTGIIVMLVFNDQLGTKPSFALTNPASSYWLPNGYASSGTYHVYVYAYVYVYPAYEQFINVYFGYFFGSTTIPFKIANIANIYEANEYDFILFNSQIRYTGLLGFIELYGARSGNIEIDIFRSLKCGEGNLTCANYLLSSSPMNASDLIQLNYQTFSVSIGYNLIPTNFVVRSGYLFRVKYLDNGSGTYNQGSLALNLNDNSPNAYFDYALSPSFAKLSHASAAPGNTINFYFRAGVNNIAPKISLSCENNTYDVYILVYCNVSTYSINETNRILVDYDDGYSDYFALPGSNQTYSGMNISDMLSNNYYITMGNGTYLLTNTEIKNDYYYLSGVELIGAKAGFISLSIAQFDVCKSCASYFYSINTFTSSYRIFDLGTFYINVGYNRLQPPTPFQWPKGFMILLNQTLDGRVAVENGTASASSAWISDYSISVEGLNLTSLNKTNASFENANYYGTKQNYRFCLSILIEDSFYVNNFTFAKNYTNSSDYNLRVAYDDYTFTTVDASTWIKVWGIWSQWAAYWQYCTRDRNYTDESGTLLSETIVVVDCSYALTLNESQTNIIGIVVDRETELKRIRENTAAELRKLDEYYKTMDAVGITFGSLNVIIMIAFAAFLIGLDIIKLLSMCNLVKPIRYAKVNRTSRYKKFDDQKANKKQKKANKSTSVASSASQPEVNKAASSPVKMKPMKAPVSQFGMKPPTPPIIVVNEVGHQSQMLTDNSKPIVINNRTTQMRLALSNGSVSPRDIKKGDFIAKFKN